MNEPDKLKDLDSGSLESTATVVEPTKVANGTVDSSASNAPTQGTADSAVGKPKHLSSNLFRRLVDHFSIYLLGFTLLLILAGAGGVVLYLKNKNDTVTNNSLSSQSLSQSTLNQLSNSDVTVGEPQHTLEVQSNAVFSGNVLLRSNVQVAGTLQVGSNLAINGIRVTGNSTFDDVQITKSLAITGNSSMQGQLNVQQSLNVNGTGTFLGALSAPSLTVGALQLTGDLNLSRHLAAGGSTPARSNGSALGSGGTSSVSGSDTAGSITINTGSSPIPGCFITITFTNGFHATPHIIVTPVGSSAAGLTYYINRSTSNFSICSTNAAPSGASFGFDYVAFD